MQPYGTRVRAQGLTMDPLGNALVDGLFDWLPPSRLCKGRMGESLMLVNLFSDITSRVNQGSTKKMRKNKGAG